MIRYATFLTLVVSVLACGGNPTATDAGTFRDGTGAFDIGPERRDVVSDLVAAEGGPGCSSVADCNDNVACTEDICSAGTCSHRPILSRCAPGSVCDAQRGCQPGRACATAADCRDTDACTVNERCDPSARLCLSDVLDGDRDGHPPRSCGGDDCDDADIFTFAGAFEYCNSRDDDCDGRVDNLAGTLCRRSASSGGLEGGTCAGNTCSCTPSQVNCSSHCVDLLADAANCGACGTECGAGNACVGGACQCPPGRTSCPNAPCADLRTDRLNCGQCGTRCPTASDCLDGACSCPTGRSFCGGRCVDPRTDSENCGACGRRCSGAATACVDGACRCPGSGLLCGDRCVDAAADPANCGGCGVACRGASNGVLAETCVMGACACRGGSVCSTADGPRCLDTSRDNSNCGACGHRCLPGSECRTGRCECFSRDDTNCSGECVRPERNTLHCGACGRACGAGEQCVASACRPSAFGASCTSDATCGPLRCLNGSCGGTCTPSPNAIEEAQQCDGSPPTVTCVSHGTLGECARGCTTVGGLGALGPCGVGRICSGLRQGDTPGCFRFCSSAADCSGATPYCGRLGACQAEPVDLTRRADGFPCTVGGTECRGTCFAMSTRVGREGICVSFINVAATPNCPDDPANILPSEEFNEDWHLCALRRCMRSSDCMAPLICRHPESGGAVLVASPATCSYPTSLQPTGL